MMDVFNSIGKIWLNYYGTMTLQTSLFLLVIMLLIVAVKKYNLILADRLGLLGLIKLFIPPVLPLGGFWAQTSRTEALAFIWRPIASFSEVAPRPSGISLPALLFIGWISLTFFLSIRTARNYLKLKRVLRSAKPFEPLPKFREFPVFSSPVAQSPFVIGFWHPRIILPVNAEKWTSEQVRLSLFHEIAHLKRKDQWRILLQVSALILFPFNPVIWIFNRQLNQLKELICDNSTISNLNISVRNYADSLVNLAGMTVTPRPLGTGALFLSENYVNLRKRILFHLNQKEDMEMLKWKKSYTAVLVAVGLLAFPLSCQQQTGTPLPEETRAISPSNQSDEALVPFVDLTEKPKVLSAAKPVYPEPARKAGVEGKVILKVLIDTDGKVSQTRILKSTPPLDPAAIAAAKKFKFAPAKMNGKPVKVWMTIPFQFRLKKDGKTK